MDMILGKIWVRERYKEKKFGNANSYEIKHINRKLKIRTVNPIYREIELKVDA